MTTREITEFHKVSVPCGDSPTGKHFVRICRAGDTVTHVSCDCQDEAREGRDAGRALAALGGESCVSVVDAIRVQLRIRAKGGEANRYAAERFDPRTGVKVSPINTYAENCIPAGLVHVIVQTISASDTLRGTRVRPESDARTLYVRLLSKYIMKYAPGLLALRVSNHQLVFERGYGGSIVVANRLHGEDGEKGGWHVNSYQGRDNLVKIANEGVGMNGNECLVCPKQAGRRFDNERQHCRGKEHHDNVARVVNELISKLNRGVLNG